MYVFEFYVAEQQKGVPIGELGGKGFFLLTYHMWKHYLN